jgi:branched-chain amino acid transport system permease protein
VGANVEAARVLGIRERSLRVIAFGVAGGIAALAGLFLSTQSGVRFDQGFEWAILGFIACIIGGSARVIGPLLGGLLVAVVQAYASYKFGQGWLDYATLGLALLFFSFRPQGIFATRTRV